MQMSNMNFGLIFLIIILCRSDVLTKDEAIAMLKKNAATKKERGNLFKLKSITSCTPVTGTLMFSQSICKQ